MAKEKVLLAMSGGIDSSVSVKILQDQGFEVVGLTFINYDAKTQEDLNFINDAKEVAKNFGIKHLVIDIRKEFKTKIIDYFVSEYLSGRTPNPCVICNRTVKWKTFLEFADNLGIHYVATGHYAKLKHENNRFFISKGNDNIKDQSYFLWNLTQEQLNRTIFPLADLTKDQIKEIAKSLGLKFLAEKKESYDVCFIKTKDYREYLENYFKENQIQIKPGKILDENGKIIGEHKGLPYYTVGQRKGLGIALGYPAFVKEINKEKNTITVVPREKLAKTIVFAKQINFQKFTEIPDKTFTVKLRYKDKGGEAKVSVEDNKLKIEFLEAVYAVAPGQSAVVYDKDDVVAGGIIL